MDYGRIIALDTSAALKETLAGDVIVVKANDLEALTLHIIEKLGLDKTQRVNDTLEITVRNGKSLLPRIMEVAAENKIFVESILLREPNLEDVFLHYTGRSIRTDVAKELHGISAMQRRKIR
jgi:ABC-2 type transport system ATP-binding protein